MEQKHNWDNPERIKALYQDIRTCLCEYTKCTDSNIIFTAYMLYRAFHIENLSNLTYADFTENCLKLRKELAEILQKLITETIWEKLMTCMQAYTEADCRELAAFWEPQMNRAFVGLENSESVIRLVLSLLQIQSTDLVADLRCGFGAFLQQAAQEYPAKHYIGYEEHLEWFLLSEIRTELREFPVQLEQKDFLEVQQEKNALRYDKVFVLSPFESGSLKNRKMTWFEQKLQERTNLLSRRCHVAWIYALAICQMLSANGKAIVLMPNGCMFYPNDREIRKYLLENNWIEAVIALPGRIFETTGVFTSLVVLSRNRQKEDGIRFIDATSLGTRGKRNDTLSASAIQTILTAMTEDNSISNWVSVELIQENEYKLLANHYMAARLHSLQNPVPFESIIKRIVRGIPYTSRQLEELQTDRESGIPYIAVSDLKDSTIAADLMYICLEEGKQERYGLTPRMLLLSKYGPPYKMAVLEIPKDQVIFASGNIYCIELDETKADPYYVQAFFESEVGRESLDNASTIGTLPTIALGKLKTLQIALPPMEEQREIASRYRRLLQEIQDTKKLLEAKIEALGHVLEH